jgi:hypothetical protein
MFTPAANSAEKAANRKIPADFLTFQKIAFGVSGALIAPVGNFFQSMGAGLLEESNPVAAMLKFVDIGPDLGLPPLVVDRHLPARSTARVKFPALFFDRSWPLGKLDENAADLLNVLIGVNHMLIAKQKGESQLSRLLLGLGPGVKRTVFGPQLFG